MGIYSKSVVKCLFGYLLVLLWCSCDPVRPPSVSFYYWRTQFRLSATERTALRDNRCSRIYLRFFDVVYDEEQRKPLPIGIVRFADTPGSLSVAPVIFIKNAVFERCTNAALDTLSGQVAQLIGKISRRAGISFDEVQIDCDWTTGTASAYFSFLRSLRKKYPDKELFRLSATIRLHQIKYARQQGIPPVDRGVLMYYNMGRIAADTLNSIYEHGIAKRYLTSLKSYPLPLDIALPVFAWGIQVRDGGVIGLLNKTDQRTFADTLSFRPIAADRYIVTRAMFKDGFYLKQGDEIKVEQVATRDLDMMARDVSGYYSKPVDQVIFYDLDSVNISRYEKIFLLRLLAAFSALLLLSYGILIACAGGDWEEYGVSVFAPEAYADSAYQPFFYSEQFYYELGHDVGHNYRFNRQVAEEWNAYLGKAAADTEVRYLLFTATPGAIDSARKMPAAAIPSLAKFRLFQQRSEKVAAFLKFLTYARANESYAAEPHDYWDYSEEQEPKVLNERQLADRLAMEKEMVNAQDKFIAQRYFFQVVRAYFFSGAYEACISFYNQHQSAYPSNLLAARTLGYVAGCYYKQKQYGMANYLYSKVYDADPTLKTVAQYSFHPQDEADWQQTLALCKDKSEQVTLWQLLGIYFDEERAIKEIYGLDPKSEKLDLLLTRLINHQEQYCNTGVPVYNYVEYHPAKDSLKKETLSLVRKIADERKTARPYAWYLAAGYLHFINGDYSKAADYFNRSKANTPTGNQLAQAQVRLFILMNNVASARRMTTQKETSLLADLLWLRDIAANPPSGLRFSSAYDWIKAQLANYYRNQGDLLHAELFVHSEEYYANEQRTAAMKSFLTKTDHTPFDQYAQSVYDITNEDICAFQSVLMALEDKTDEAIVLMSSASSTADMELLGNPFNGNIQDCHDCDHAAPQKIKYTKRSLLLKLKEMKAKLARGEEVYNNSLLLGNAYYNISHYGNARIFYEGKILGGPHSSPESISSFFKEKLISNNLSVKYYQQALQAAKDDEQKAKVTYLLLKCERNELYNKLNRENSWEYADIPPIPFSRLEPYRNTQYYKEVINECGYFRRYLAKNK